MDQIIQEPTGTNCIDFKPFLLDSPLKERLKLKDDTEVHQQDPFISGTKAQQIAVALIYLIKHNLRTKR